MSEINDSKIKQNPNRWNGFVFIAWTIAIITWLFGVYILMEVGTINMPYGGGSTLNVGVWAWIIGQSLGVLLIAGLFSMLNSIYKNTCRALPEVAVSEKKPASTGFELNNAPKDSPLYSKSGPGFFINTVNGSPVSSREDVNEKAKVGKNEVMVRYPGGQTSVITVNSDDGILIS